MTIAAETKLETAYGLLTARLYEDDGGQCLVITNTWDSVPVVRIHSQCLFGEILHSMHCDCQWQLSESLREIGRSGGIFLYLFQEGRGVGLAEKIRAMQLQSTQGINTAEAFKRLGRLPDMRSYELAIKALHSIGAPSKIRLITNNPNKIAALEISGFTVVERIEFPIQMPREVVARVHEDQVSLGHFVAAFNIHGRRSHSQ